MLNLGSRVVAFGECMVELRRQNGPLMVQSFGGDTLNTATYLSRLSNGHFTVHYATALGDTDSFSQGMIERWQSEGIQTDFVRRLNGELPGIYTIDVDQNGERTFAYWRSNSAAKKYFDTDLIPLDVRFDDYDLFYFSGISLAILSPDARSRLFSLIEKMKASGKTIVFDNNYRLRLWTSPIECASAYEYAYRLSDIALVTLSDEMERSGDSDEKSALKGVLSLPPGEMVVKRGSSPTIVRSEGGAIAEIPTVKVSNVVDTTAAGDSFGAGYLAARLRGLNPEKAAKIGNQLAGTVIQFRGAIIPAETMPQFFE